MSAVDTIRDVDALDSPYVGLNFYTQENEALFFGRDSERMVLISNLRASRLTLLYAKSGTGKSSLLRAGVAAKLEGLARRSFSQRGTARNIPVVFSSWRDDPTAGLISEIQQATSPFVRATSPPRPPPDRLDEAIEAASQATDAALLVILDQFEEYLLYRWGEVGDRSFADELAACINRADLRTNFLISIREDAYFLLGDLFEGRISNVYGNYFHLEHLTLEAAREAIEKPIASFNDLHPGQAPVDIEPALVNEVLKQFEPGQPAPNQAGAGPLKKGNGTVSHRHEVHASYLQLVMKGLWDAELGKGSRKLRLQTLEDLGGARAISRNHVERVLGNLSDKEREAAVAIFHHLVTPSGIKVALAAPDLAEYIHRPVDEASTLLQRLVGTEIRILRSVPPPPGQAEGTRFEIAHDLLIEAVQKWEKREEEARLEREKKVAEQEKKAAEHKALAEEIRARKYRRRALMTTLVAIFAVLATIAAIVFRVGEQTAVGQGHLAQSEGMAAEAINLLPTNGPLAMLLSLQAYETAPTLQAGSALIQAVQQPLNGRLVSGTPVASVAFSPDGKILAVGNDGGSVVLWDLATRKMTATLAEGRPVTGVAFSPDGRTAAVGDSGGDVGLWDVTSGKRIAVLAEDSPVESVAFSPDGQVLAVGDGGGDVGLWNVATGKRTATLAEGSPVTGVAFSPDGQVLAVGDYGGDIGLWNVAAGKRTATLAEGSPVTRVAFSPNGHTVAVGDGGGDVGLWNVDTRQRTVLAEDSPVESVAFDPGGQVLAVGDGGGDVGLWNVATRQRTATLAEGAPVESMAFSPGGPTLVTGDSLGNVGIWNTGNGQELARLTEGSAVTSLAFSAHDGALAIGDPNGEIALLWQNLANFTRRYFTQLICGRVQGNMTQVQWADYAPGQKYHSTCS